MYGRNEEVYGLPTPQISTAGHGSPSPVMRYGSPANRVRGSSIRARSANRFEGIVGDYNIAIYSRHQVLTAREDLQTERCAATTKGHSSISHKRCKVFHNTKPGRYRKDTPSAPRGNVLRTLFMQMKHGCFTSTYAIGACFSTFGEVADVVNLLASKRICYVSFFDSRSARQAMLQLDKHLVIDGTEFILKESYHRPDVMGRLPMEDDYQGTVLVSLTSTKRTLSNSDRAHFEEYGEVCQFYPYKEQQNEWVVEYYDIRAAKRAAYSNHGLPYLKGIMYTTFLWDEVVDADHHDVHKPHSMNRGNDSNKCYSKRAVYSGTAIYKDVQMQSGSEMVSAADHPSKIDDVAPKRSYESIKTVVDDEPKAVISAKNVIYKPTDEIVNARATSPNPDGTMKSAPSSGLMQQVQDAREILLQHQRVLGLGTPPSSVMEPQYLTSTMPSEYKKAATSVEETDKHDLTHSNWSMNDRSLPDVVLQSTPAADPAPELTEQRASADQSGKSDALQSLIVQSLPGSNNDTLELERIQQYGQVHKQAHVPASIEISKSIYESEHSDGISRLLGILAQVRRPDQEGEPK
ncbi:hypothetical protein H4R24_005017 [Coemansia sp. RSA 988]|nr:hypothetical protein H4R24_005017 [Coemansia sp. RSA 988]